jgi:hypothetical protein
MCSLNWILSGPQRQYGRFGEEKNLFSYRWFEPRLVQHLYTDCAVPCVMLRNTFVANAATYRTGQRKGLHCGLGCRENLDELGNCHLLKADCAGDGFDYCRTLARESS